MSAELHLSLSVVDVIANAVVMQGGEFTIEYVERSGCCHDELVETNVLM
jgi:hypothetical protein